MLQPIPPASEVRLQLRTGQTVSALLQEPAGAFARLVLAHGAGAGMDHPFLSAVAAGLAARGVATLRFQFLFMEAGSRRPDRPAVAHDAVRAAIAYPGHLPLFAGGKSFGARMVSQAQAASGLTHLRGLVFFGFPLHPAKRPSLDRAEHMASVALPMLFLQGTRDALADYKLLTQVVATLGSTAELVTVADADHSFQVPARTGRSDQVVLGAMLDKVTDWMRKQVTSPATSET